MAQTEPPKSRLNVEMELDRISSLPDDVIDKILSCLPLKEAVRTSVLSIRWKDKWAMLSRLVFDEKCLSIENCETFANIVDQVFSSHIAPIHEFVLSGRDRLLTRDIDRWVLHLSRNPVMVFELHLHGYPCYKMPLCFFSYQHMIELKLTGCQLQPPRTFKGFVTLKRVTFSSVILAQNVLENLMSYCPLLESLEMRYCGGFKHLKIDAPNLRFLSFSGWLQDVSLQNTLNLAVVHFNLSRIYRQRRVSSSKLAEFFVDLSHIQRLTLDGISIQYLAGGDLPGRLPKQCLDLSFLQLTVHFNDRAEILTTLYLLRSSPALEELDVEVRVEGVDIAIDEEANCWMDNLDDGIKFSLPKLRLVQITYFTGCKAELDFIKLLLLNSPLLETMTVRASSADGSFEVFKKLLQLRRTSSVHIIYLDPWFINESRQPPLTGLG